MKRDATYDEFRSTRAKLAWLCNTRPDISCAVAKLAQVKEETYSEASVKAANKFIAHVLKSKELGIEVPQLDLESVVLEVYTDAALANNEDFSSQIGYVVVLKDRFGKANILEYTSKKCRRVTHSSLAGEIMAFSAGFDAAFILKHDLEAVTRKRIPLYMMMDSMALFDMVTRNAYSSERRLMIDMAAIRESYRRHEIDGLVHISGSDNPADCLV